MRPASAVVLASALVATASAAAAPPQPLFPLADGNRWTLRDARFGAARTIAVERRADGLVLTGFPGAGPLRVRNVAGTVQAWDAADGRWEPLLRLRAPVGTKYPVDLEGVPLWETVQVTVSSRRAVAHGIDDSVFRGCTRLTFRYGKALADAGLVDLVFAPGVGPVRFTEQTIAGPRASLLESFRIR